MNQHTPTPWICEGIHVLRGQVKDHDFTTIAQVSAYPNDDYQDTREANAAFIVQAVNSYATMLAALREVRSARGFDKLCVCEDMAYELENCVVHQFVPAAIAAARGEA